MPKKFTEECPDPGVDMDYDDALLDNRIALAECRKRQQNAVKWYAEYRKRLVNGSKPI